MAQNEKQIIDAAIENLIVDYNELFILASTLACWNSDDGTINPRGAETGVSKPHDLSLCMRARQKAGEQILKPVEYEDREKFPDPKNLIVPTLCQSCTVSQPLRTGIINIYRSRTRT